MVKLARNFTFNNQHVSVHYSRHQKSPLFEHLDRQVCSHPSQGTGRRYARLPLRAHQKKTTVKQRNIWSVLCSKPSPFYDVNLKSAPTINKNCPSANISLFLIGFGSRTTTRRLVSFLSIVSWHRFWCNRTHFNIRVPWARCTAYLRPEPWTNY